MDKVALIMGLYDLHKEQEQEKLYYFASFLLVFAHFSCSFW